MQRFLARNSGLQYSGQIRNLAAPDPWEQNIPGYLRHAGGKWAGQLEPKHASRDAVPAFKTKAPLAE